MTDELLNLFFAILPDQVTAKTLEGFASTTKRQYHFTQNIIPAERLHISLHAVEECVTEISFDQLEKLKQVASQVRADPFPVTFDRALSFRRNSPKQPFVITGGAGLDGLREFRSMLGETVGPYLATSARNSFTPHVTLCYDEKSVPSHPIPPMSWTVRDFALVLSHVGQSRYEFLGRWALTGSSGAAKRNDVGQQLSLFGE
jgi:RNA 2',3'-cyclic 3'-phosphodiesterase